MGVIDKDIFASYDPKDRLVIVQLLVFQGLLGVRSFNSWKRVISGLPW